MQAVRAEAPSKDFIATCMTVLTMAFASGYVITYESFPSIATALAAGVAASVLVLLVVTSVFRWWQAAATLGAVAVLVLLTVLLDWTTEPQQYDALTNYIVSVAVVFTVRLAPVPDLRRTLAVMGVCVLCYAAFVAAIGGNYLYAGVIRVEPFWSGVHSSSLMVAGLTALVALSPFRRGWKVVWVGLGLLLLGLYGVVTPFIMVAVFFGGWFFVRHGWNRFWLYLLAAVSVVVGVLFRNENSVAGARIDALGFESIGSGRLDSWLLRLNEFTLRDLPTMLAGRGPYSDYQVTDLWWWEEKNAHSDVVTMLMEFGLIGLGAVLFAGVAYYKGSSEVERLAFIAVAFGAAASNAFLDRPMVSVAWGMVLYASRYQIIHRLPKERPHRRANRQAATPRGRARRQPQPPAPVGQDSSRQFALGYARGLRGAIGTSRIRPQRQLRTRAK